MILTAALTVGKTNAQQRPLPPINFHWTVAINITVSNEILKFHNLVLLFGRKAFEKLINTTNVS